MIENKMTWVRWIVVCSLIAAFGLLNLQTARDPRQSQIVPRPAATRSTELYHSGILCTQPDSATGDCISVWNGGDINVYNNAGGNNKFSVDGDTGNVTSAGTVSGAIVNATTLQMGSVAFTGAIKYGASTVYTSGNSITHGFSTTPTVCGLIGSSALVTASVSSITTTGFALTTQADGATVYWMCGK